MGPEPKALPASPLMADYHGRALAVALARMPFLTGSVAFLDRPPFRVLKWQNRLGFFCLGVVGIRAPAGGSPAFDTQCPAGQERSPRRFCQEITTRMADYLRHLLWLGDSLQLPEANHFAPIISGGRGSLRYTML